MNSIGLCIANLNTIFASYLYTSSLISPLLSPFIGLAPLGYFVLTSGINEYFLIVLSGVLVLPVVSFVIPIVYYNKYFWSDPRYKNQIRINWIVLCLAMVISIVSAVSVITEGAD